MKKLTLFALLPAMAILSSCGGGNQIDELRMNVIIDYSKSIDDLVTMGNYDLVNSGISNNAFIQKGGDDKKDTIMTREAILLNFNRKMSSEDIVAQMVVRGLRPATARELLTLGNEYPRLQREMSIIALGSKTTASKVPGLWGDWVGRRVDL